jgi:hypothetical protein
VTAGAASLIGSLRDESRIVEAEFAGGRRAWVPTTDAGLYAGLATGAGLERIVLRLLRTRGPVTAAWVAERWGARA